MSNFTRRAFTMIEMIAVLTLIIVISGLAVASFQGVIGETRSDSAYLLAQGFAKDLDATAALYTTAPADYYGDESEGTNRLTAVRQDLIEGPDFIANGDGTITVVSDAGALPANQRCATITLSNVVGGTSTVAKRDNCELA